MDYKDKIRKLLALAKSPEPEEAKLALLKARKLMAEHKLTERDLEERNTTVIKRAIGETFSKKANSWMDPLSIIIGENYCCSAFRCKISAKTTIVAPRTSSRLMSSRAFRVLRSRDSPSRYAENTSTASISCSIPISRRRR